MTTSTHAPAHSFTMLLARYISGAVEPEQLGALCDLVESTDATPAERLAFARYYLDTMGEDEATLPKPEEWAAITGTARA